MIRIRAAWRQALVLMLGGCALAAALGACSAAGTLSAGTGAGTPPSGTATPPPDLPAVVVSDGAGAHAVTVIAGQRLEVILGSSYWNVAGSSRPGVLRQDGEPALTARPASCPALPGLGCTPLRADFTALGPGTAVITAGRSSCGEALACAPGQRHFTLTVTVRAAR